MNLPGKTYLAVCVLLLLLCDEVSAYDSSYYDHRNMVESQLASPFEGLKQAISLQARKFDIALTRLFKTFILADRISLSNIQNVLNVEHLDEETLLEQLHLSREEFRLDRYTTNEKELALRDERAQVQNKANRRMLLDADCKNGVSVNQTYTVYTCNGTKVTSDEYEGKCTVHIQIFNGLE